MKKLILILLISIVGVSCKKNDDSPEEKKIKVEFSGSGDKQIYLVDSDWNSIYSESVTGVKVNDVALFKFTNITGQYVLIGESSIKVTYNGVVKFQKSHIGANVETGDIPSFNLE